MRDIARSTVIAAAVAGLTLSVAVAVGDSAFAQTKQPPTASEASTPAEKPIKQLALTEKQIEGVLAAQKDMAALDDKLPESSNVEPDGKAAAELEAVSRKAGFASYAEYNDVIDNISLVLAGFDPATKKYIGSDAVLKQQIAAVKSDTKMPSKDKKQALDDMKAALQTPAPAIEKKGNIDLVGKYYDKLVGALSGDEDD
ncbi:conserved hypothetical protein [Nitrobacter winogradskyi Nb-255]|uniref:Uncharacterized protein n=1 Tax=Nitrobacter winogradskyi (strain ATCC 25391 / DSM 10237 / CIP 104748 / NCIMB 11846 / Nb-255) TaxID=323098 RepID=Q3SV56_NITWN|nr:hypothetical protein [Nitrobacter winogradskyi]ABA03835.1 conserved hypothetical protein [Nitrobacter winogradskyi Nb-255]